MRRNKSIFGEHRSCIQYLEARRERIHFGLHRLWMLVGLHANPGIPGIVYIAILILNLLPQGGILRLNRGDQILRLAMKVDFRMHGGQEDNVCAYFTEFRRLLVHLPVSTEEDHDVECDEPNGDHRPATPLHVFVTQWDQHTSICLSKWK